MSEKMQVGPELNKLVHYKLFGVKLQLAPRYSTDWNAMRLVVEEMRRRNWQFVLNDDLDKYTAIFFWDPNGSSYEEASDTAPHAVCLAALQALEAETHA